MREEYPWKKHLEHAKDLKARFRPVVPKGGASGMSKPRRIVPPRHQIAIFHMMDGWTSPEQVLAQDIEHWIRVLENARAATLTEVFSPKKLLTPRV